MKIPTPAMSHQFRIRIINKSKINDRYDPLTRVILYIEYDIKNNNLEMGLHVPIDDAGEVETELNRLCLMKTPTILIERIDGSNTIGYSIYCDISKVESCIIRQDYSDFDVLLATVKCKVKKYNVYTNIE